LQIELCKESIEWAKAETRTFLRQRIETRLADLYLKTKEYTTALELLTNLLREVKRLDDKLLLVEIQLSESRVHHRLRNYPKAKAALTAARTSANAIYCPPRLQGHIDMISGTLHAEERDYKTGFSYFFESFEGFTSLNTLIDDKQAILALKYMLLCKIMTNHPEEVSSVLHNKMTGKYAGPDVDAMRAVAQAHKNRSLNEFEKVLEKFHEQLLEDPIISSHLSDLYDTLLEQNLARIIEPFSCVEIEHIAELIELPVEKVEKKLSKMILDKKVEGILDQGAGSLTVFDEQITDKTYPTALKTMNSMGKVVETLFEKANKLK